MYSGPRDVKKRGHVVVMGLATFCLLIGVAVVFYAHWGPSHDDLYSVHSWIGLLVTIMCSGKR